MTSDNNQDNFHSRIHIGIIKSRLISLKLWRLLVLNSLAKPHIVQPTLVAKTYLANCAHGQRSCPISRWGCRFFWGIHTLGCGWYIPHATITRSFLNGSCTRKNSQVHGSVQHESDLKLPSCKRTIWLGYFPTIVAHSIEDSRSILSAETFGPLHTVSRSHLLTLWQWKYKLA